MKPRSQAILVGIFAFAFLFAKKVPVSAGTPDHWAFRPLSISTTRTPAIDDFLLAALTKQNLKPAPQAPWSTLLRRLYFSVTGLPPTPAEMRSFLESPSLAKYEAVVDKLLAAPGYGERFGQHWLDVIRYAESEGFEYDRHLPDGWRFRDYVIQSFNDDLPFDVFIREQIAGDESESPTRQALVAAGFHRLGPVRRNAGNPDVALSRNEVLTERTDIIGPAILGLSIGCARCHDHKLEPVSQRDYYQLEAYFAATTEHNVVIASDAEQRRHQAATQAVQEQIAPLKKSLTQATGDRKKTLAAEIRKFEEQLPPDLPTITSIRNAETNRTPIHILNRGVWEQKGDAVGMRPPSALVPDELAELPADTPHPRTRLAEWLTSPDNPLTARVIVNRVWQHHFGTGLVKTANDFGRNGDRPSHPELLDHLAQTLIRNGWHLKPLHRMILLSAAYRRDSSLDRPDAARIDPENRLLWRGPRRRLSAEELRDSMLMISGRLNPKAGGPGVMVPVDEELIALLYKPAQWSVTPDPSEHDRRSIYLVAKRNLRLPFLEVFDQPPPINSCARRESGTHAPQALELLNGRLANDLAKAFAARLQHDAGPDSGARVERAFLLATGRPPNDEERRLSAEFLANGSLREFALAVFNLNDFLHVH
ncbi:MAG: DUF1553 domain-containing protein [Verrucomicrobiae bacterium]|nr:DUF1553 domain-containing protein [Verrucomicrobiae bacterium]